MNKLNLRFCATLIAVFCGAWPAFPMTFAYVSNGGSNTIAVLRVDTETIDLTAVQTVSLEGVEIRGDPPPLAVSPDRRFLFVAAGSQPSIVLCYAISPAVGRLTKVSMASTPGSMANITTDRSGKFLLGASYASDILTINPIEEGGMIGPPSQVVKTGPHPHAVIIDNDNRLAYATILGEDSVSSFNFDPKTGRLDERALPAAHLSQKSGPRHFTFHPNGKFVYLLNELSGTVVAFSYDAHFGEWKKLQELSAVPPGFSGRIWAADIHITPDGRFIYASERSSSTLSMFAVDSKAGTLTSGWNLTLGAHV